MGRSPNRFLRRSGTLSYRRRFVLAVEGAKTEREYFAILGRIQQKITIKCLTHKYKTSPTNVMDRLEGYLKKNRLKKSDEAWIVIDKDQWSDDQLNKVSRWSKLRENCGLAVSNPKF